MLSNRPFRRLWLAAVASRIGDGAALIALLLYVKGIEHSGIAVGGLLLAQSVPHLLGPGAGVLADRLDGRRLMVACELTQAGIFAFIAWWQPPYLALLALVLSASMLDTTFGPAAQRAVVGLVKAPRRMQANAWLGTSVNLQVAAGPLVGGVLVSAFGPRGGLGANALSFAISGLLLTGLPRLEPASPSGGRGGIFSAGTDGLAFAWRNPVIRGIVLLVFLFVAFGAVDNVSLVFLTRDALHVSALGFAVASAAFGVGMLAGSVGLSIRAFPRLSLPILLAGGFLNGMGTLITGLAPSLGVAAGTQAIAGLGNGIDNVARTTLVQEAVPSAMVGQVFGLIGAAAFAGTTVAYVLAGLLLDATSARVTFVVGGAGALLALLGLGPLLVRASGTSRRGRAPT